MAARKFRILVCRGPECGERRGSRDIHDAFAAALDQRSLRDSVSLGWQSCFGRCTQGPNVLVQEVAAPRPGERVFLLATMPFGRAGRSALYSGVCPGDVEDIIENHVLRDRLVSRLIEPPAHAGAGYSRPASANTRVKPSEEGSEGES
ncbi:MAG TPA: (2Fe-2S) ferredoxin domain-containing protein [Kofleriaceae bacterium]|nr:(2Fe-2S) ferredoxin domain-containing protein [Kofleriaceae bacterium]